ncbi:2'-5' RNA ligase [Leptospira inadai serovar Lyme str. 10]|uniref:RNA 2',3'-cyclic phosphodiesterase n=2 Tax=Leptospira inadai serovar Lyme TaxID=293084 RepID=V6HB05_9LEPT|nr:RNA 2',3'-cyclic phosphodiesterase [Leptospira inadai]EQA35693.1 2'-5' RNA ligase [Leptospira inadai serovar Lyme str. 10]PNV75435.1 RNA 2',3'-cyclic phosphodiesterase [Leptospira inadai serovar Lyme]
MRIFLGISLPDRTREVLAGICYGLEGARWVSPENFHVTLVFLGEISSDKVEQVHEICASTIVKPFSISLHGLGWFRQKSPSILYAGVDRSLELQGLQKSLESGCRRYGFSVEKREYIPHVTIGRLRDVAQDKVMIYLNEFESIDFPAFEVSEFHVYSSRSGSEGPIYRIEDSFSLGES